MGLIASGLSPLAVAAPAQAGPAQAAVSCADSSPGAAQAGTLARACGRRVEAAELRTENGQTFVNPDGSHTVELTALPTRVRQSSGSWAPVDLTLRRNADGTVSPVAAPVTLTLSGGGGGPLVRAARDGRELALTWPGTLPEPVIDGEAATYPEVLPGVDLRVRAEVTGYSEVLVVKTPAAARNPALRKITFGTKTTGFTLVEKPGEILAGRDPRGEEVFQFSSALMWESQARPVRAPKLAGQLAAPLEPARAARQSVMPVEAGPESMSVIPDAGLLTDPDATFPILIDPKATAPTRSSWCLVGGLNSSWKTQSYWFGGADTDKLAKVGYATDPKGNALYRSLFQWDSPVYKGTEIIRANFSVELNNAWHGGSEYQVQLWEAGGISPSTTWNNAVWSRDLGWRPVDGGRLEYDITHAVRTSTSPNLTLGLTTNESNVNYWKRFKPDTATISVTYNRRPDAPVNLRVDEKPCAKGSARPWITTATPILKAYASDADGDSMKVWISNATWYNGSWVGTGAGYQDHVPSGTDAQWTASGLTDGGIYSFRAQSDDYSHPGPLSVDFGTCEYQVDLSDPAAPAVSSDVYQAPCPKDGCGASGRTGTFTFQSSPDVTSYKWGFSDPPSYVASASSGAATVSWTPQSGGPKSLYVKAVDRAGRTTTTVHQFTVAREASAVGVWKLDEGAGAPKVANTGTGPQVLENGQWVNNPSTYDATRAGNDVTAAPGPVRNGDTAFRFPGTEAGYVKAPKVIDPTRSYTVSAWARLASFSQPQHLVTQCGGAYRCEFYLSYEPGAGKWAFQVPSTGGNEPSLTFQTAYSFQPPKLGVWTHLTGVYDAAGGRVKLYVNGVLEGTAPAPSSWQAASELFLGHNVHGDMAQAQVWNRAISPGEIAKLVSPARVGDWAFGEDNPPSTDDSGYGNDLEWNGDASVPSTTCGHDGRCLTLPGTPGWGSTEKAVIDTDQSYSVSAWAKLANTSADYVVLTQDNPSEVKPFYLKYDKASGRWAMQITQSGTGTGTSWTAKSLAPAAVNTWTSLQGVYDAQSGQVTLYVNGVLQETVGGAAGWQSSGSFLIGSQKTSGHFAGQIDSVQVSQGLPSASPAADDSPHVTILSSATGRCTSLNHMNDASLLEMWGCNGMGHQKFQFRADGSIISTANGRCVSLNTMNDGSVLEMWGCNGMGHQKFELRADGSIVSSATGRCVSLNTMNDGSRLETWGCNGMGHQKFRLG
ncbi:LamG-like jellyroll fold domain-containing protein [Longispora albida]|uniref:LamG-like jellyroll fold domain-containing protein n=1 Tax=Longispora albida TaxID=203523 RepID=UPI0012FA15EB|nr:LamG-like jellyroll fold domain-containing protein [Longispora albida]